MKKKGEVCDFAFVFHVSVDVQKNEEHESSLSFDIVKNNTIV